MGHDDTGSSSDWHLESIVVAVKSCTSTFSVWKWLGKAAPKERDVYNTLEEGECLGSIKKMAGEYVITYSNSRVIYKMIFGKDGTVTR